MPRRFLSLDAFRGLAAMGVFLYHLRARVPFLSESVLVENGDRFVDLFFVLSGFVIAHGWEGRITHSGSLKDFFLGRMRRLLPLHYFTLILFLCLLLLSRMLHLSGEAAGSDNNAYSFVLNVFLLHAFGLSSGLSWNRPSWSISAEAFSSIVFGCIVFLFPRKVLRYSFWILIAGACLAWFLFRSEGYLCYDFDYGWLRALLGFTAGYACRQVFPWMQGRIQMRTALSFILELSALALAIAGFYLPAPLTILLVPVYMILILVFAFEAGPVAKFLKHAVFQTGGRLSYSIYLNHTIVILVTGFVAGRMFPEPGMAHSLFMLTASCCALIVLSRLTRRWIEERFLGG